jgi:hypothetical protein
MDRGLGPKRALFWLVFLMAQLILIASVRAEWTSVSPPAVSSNWELLGLRGFWGVGQDLAGKQGVLLHFSNGSWAAVTAPSVSTDWGLAAIDFGSAYEGWAVGLDNASNSGALLHYENGAWTSVEPTVEISSDWGLSAVDSLSSTGGWMAGQDFANKRGILLHYENVLVTPPVVSTDSASNLTTTTATSGGNITSDGGASVTARGVCWNTALNPVVGGTCTSDGTGTGAFTSSIAGLTANTAYHVRAYATNSVGTGYGNDVIFKTLSTAALPTVTTTAVSGITETTAISGGTVTSTLPTPVTARGVCWGALANPIVEGGTCKQDIGVGTGVFTVTITGLTPGTPYHVRAYATNSAGTGYGLDVLFTTLSAPGVPAVTTAAPSGVTGTTATSGGTITSNGLTPLTAWGVCWNTVGSPVFGSNCTNESNLIPPVTFPYTFTSSITGLIPNTGYFVRAYATNSVGTSYGNEFQFFTLASDVASHAATLSNGTDTTPPITRLVLTSAILPDVSTDWGLSGVRLVWSVGQDSANKRGVLLYFASGSWISVVPPDVSSDWGLSGVDAISPNEAWAVGQDNQNKRGVLLHFVNGAWESVDPPDVSADWELSGIVLLSSSEGWAAGTDHQNKRGVLLHFINGLWEPVELPDVSADWGLSAVDLISFNQGWAVGKTSNGQDTAGVLLQYTVPLISASPAAINYHDVEVGAYSDQTVIVKNAGNGNLVIGAITSPSSPFAIQADGCSGIALPPLQTCKVTYRFLPDSEGAFYDSSTIPSNGYEVTVTLTGTGNAGTVNYINLADPPDGQTYAICPDLGSSLFQWESSGVFAGIELQYSLTPDFSKIPVRVKGHPGTNQVALRSDTWKKVLLLPGPDGGVVYWTVIGAKKDKTTVAGNVYSFEVSGAGPVVNPEISQTSKTTLPPPTLSWENQCNTKFKAWFGNSTDIQTGVGKKVAISYNVQDPNENQGIFTRALTSSQWSSIRRLGGNVTGAVLYWYVESWDALGRRNKTAVTSFTLTD